MHNSAKLHHALGSRYENTDPTNWKQGLCSQGGSDVTCTAAAEGARADTAACGATTFPIPRDGIQSIGLDRILVRETPSSVSYLGNIGPVHPHTNPNAALYLVGRVFFTPPPSFCRSPQCIAPLVDRQQFMLTRLQNSMLMDRCAFKGGLYGSRMPRRMLQQRRQL